MIKDRLSKLEEKVSALTKCITSLNESLKDDRLMRLMRVKKQCEDLSISLNCKDLENGSHEDVECDVLVPQESKHIYDESHEEESRRNEFDFEVGVEETKLLKFSPLSEIRRKNIAVGMLLCNCESCMKGSQDQRLDELLGCRVGHNVATVYNEEQLGLVVGKGVQNAYIPPCLKASNLLGCENLCLNLNMSVLKGKTYNILTPHFHCSMLVRLMIGLIGVIVDSSLFVGRNDVPCLSSHKNFDVEICCDSKMVDGCFDLNCFTIIVRRVKLLWAYIVVVIFPTWESFGEVKMEQRKISYFIFQTQFFENDVGFECSEFYLGWCTLKGSIKSVVMLYMGEDGECQVPIMYRDLFESNNSRKGGCSCHMTAEMQQWGCCGVVFKVLHIGHPPMKGTGHRDNNVTKLTDEITYDSESFQMQGEVAESNGKWSRIAVLDEEAKNEVDRAVCAGLIFGDLNLKSSIWEAEDYGKITECKALCPFHYGRVNRKMRIFQASSTKNYLMLVNLSSNLVRMNLLDTRKMGLTMLLNWMLKVMPTIEFKVAWVAVINAKTVGATASSDKTKMDVFEWMIAWGGQDRAEFIRQTILNDDDSMELRAIPFQVGVVAA